MALRALGTIGVKYRYSLKSVNCEAFATVLYRMPWDPVQRKVIASFLGLTFKNWTKRQREKAEAAVQIYKDDLWQSIDIFEKWIREESTQEKEEQLETEITPYDHIWQQVLNKIAALGHTRLGYQWWRPKVIDVIGLNNNAG